MRSSAMMNVLIAIGITGMIGYALMAHLQNRSRRRARADSGYDGSNYSSSDYGSTSSGFSLGSWFSSDRSALDSSGNPADSGSCSVSSDNGSGSDSGGGDCGGGGDGGGGGGD
ncbi:hypothetical protein JQ596_34840 [Bradyrhizobium manausense]|nr:hypothetical protein [Bradyrhizobium manausense]UVO31076.1 hypothetical protein KUF59_10725 [Bradyrhizobium arachidis]